MPTGYGRKTTMSDEATPTDPVTEVTPAEGAEKGGQSGNYTPPATQADLDRIIADRISRERAKYADYDDLKAAAEQLSQIEEANKTEAQKQAERMAELEAKVKEYETREQIAAWAREVSDETGVPADVLSGSTKEELAAHAEKLKPLIESAKQDPEAPRPAVVPTIGTTPETPTAISLDAMIEAAEQSGDSKKVRELKALKLGSLSA